MKRIIRSILAPTPRKNKIRGQIFTAFGTICSAALYTGVFEDPFVVWGLVVCSVLFGGIAFSDAVKVRR